MPEVDGPPSNSLQLSESGPVQDQGEDLQDDLQDEVETPASPGEGRKSLAVAARQEPGTPPPSPGPTSGSPSGTPSSSPSGTSTPQEVSEETAPLTQEVKERILSGREDGSSVTWQDSGESDSVNQVNKVKVKKSCEEENKSNKNTTKIETIRTSKRKRSQMENDPILQEINSNYLNKKTKLSKDKRTFNDKNSSTGLYHCQLCRRGFSVIKKLVEHSQEHAGETYHCLQEGCPFKTVSYCSLRSHYYNKANQPVQTKNSDTTTLEIVEENDDDSIKKKIQGFACPFDRCNYISEVKDFDLDEDEALATLYQHEGDVHGMPREQRCYQLVFHDLQGEDEDEEDD